MASRQLGAGQERSETEGFSLEWVEADAEELPFPDDRFDVVASVFGAVFAPRPERVAAELFRVAKPGGLVAMANYSNRGFLARFNQLVTGYAPPASVEVPSLFRWGDPDEVWRRFAGLASSIETEHRTATFEFGSTEEWREFWERTNGPQVAFKTLLPEETYEEMLAQAARLIQELNRSDDGRLALESEYLLVLARKKRPAPA